MPRYSVKLPDAVWLATATLHQKKGNHKTFSTNEIRKQVEEQKVGSSINSRSISDSIVADCVANHKATMRPSHRKLYKESRGKYRLYRRNEDKHHESRNGCPIEPDKKNLPLKFRHYIEWYRDDYCGEKKASLQDTNNVHNQSIVPAAPVTAESPGGTSANKQNEDMKCDLNCVPDLSNSDNDPPSNTAQVVNRTIRDSAKVKRIKDKYKNECQVCGYIIQVASDYRYSEVHHLHQLKDGGNDDYNNMLVLCPTHHVEFDYAIIGVSGDGRNVVDRNGGMKALTMLEGHTLDPKNIESHRKRMRIPNHR